MHRDDAAVPHLSPHPNKLVLTCHIAKRTAASVTMRLPKRFLLGRLTLVYFLVLPMTAAIVAASPAHHVPRHIDDTATSAIAHARRGLAQSVGKFAKGCFNCNNPGGGTSRTATDAGSSRGSGSGRSSSPSASPSTQATAYSPARSSTTGYASSMSQSMRLSHSQSKQSFGGSIRIGSSRYYDVSPKTTSRPSSSSSPSPSGVSQTSQTSGRNSPIASDSRPGRSRVRTFGTAYRKPSRVSKSPSTASGGGGTSKSASSSPKTEARDLRDEFKVEERSTAGAKSSNAA